jgi:hypothetical protein
LHRPHTRERTSCLPACLPPVPPAPVRGATPAASHTVVRSLRGAAGDPDRPDTSAVKWVREMQPSSRLDDANRGLQFDTAIRESSLTS